MSKGVNQNVLNWLHRVLQPDYRNAQRTFDDVAEVLHSVKSLRTKTDVYTFEDGKTYLLLLLYGTIPVDFRDQAFNIPLQIWLPHEYPRRPPMIFVVPSSGLALRPGNYVDVDYRCYHPYLAYWSEDIRRSILSQAITLLQQAFALEPPIVALSASSFEPNSGDHRRIVNSITSTKSNSNHVARQQPPVPAKITERVVEKTSQHDLEKSVRDRPVPPPVPVKLSNRNSGQSSNSTANIPIRQNYSYVSPSVGAMHSSTIQHSGMREGAQISLHPISNAKSQTSGTVELRLIRVLNTLAEQASSDASKRLADLSVVTNELSRQEAEFSTLYRNLEQIQSSALANTEILKTRILQAKKSVQEIELADRMDADDTVIAQNVVYNQLYDLVVDEMALDDTIYALGRALESDRIDVDVFLKNTRSLAREQFIQRALIAKITNLLGLQSS